MSSVDLILPTRNRCEYLAKTLEFLAHLEVEPFSKVRILVVDNGSHDATKSVVESAHGRFSHPELIYLFEQKQGRSAALNCGVRFSDADVLVFTDDDVAPEPAWLRELCLPVVDGKIDGQSGPLVADSALIRPEALDGTYDIVQFFGSETGAGPDFVGANMALSRKVFDSGLMYDEELGAGASGYGEDTLLAQSARRAGFALTWNPNVKLIHQFDTTRLERIHQIHAYERKGETYALLRRRSGHVSRVKVRVAYVLFHYLLEKWRRQHPTQIDDFGIRRSEARLIAKVAEYRRLLKGIA